MTLELTPISNASDGELLTLAAAKDYLRLTTTDEDDAVAGLIAAAEAFLASRIGRIFTAASVAEQVSVGRNSRGFGVANFPVSPSVAPVVIDPAGDDVTALFDIDYATGRFRAHRLLTDGTYTVTYTGGLSLSPRWDDWRVMLAGAVRDLVAEWYANRDPGASSVTDGDMSRVTDGGIPPRVSAVISLLRGW